ncbi:MAG TPA: hypothetical protein VGV87_21510 [Blastocatellia bacterium]|nr:hypothetical protein [Blastocatellia bacterium]
MTRIIRIAAKPGHFRQPGNDRGVNYGIQCAKAATNDELLHVTFGLVARVSS